MFVLCTELERSNEVVVFATHNHSAHFYRLSQVSASARLELNTRKRLLQCEGQAGERESVFLPTEHAHVFFYFATPIITRLILAALRLTIKWGCAHTMVASDIGNPAHQNISHSTVPSSLLDVDTAFSRCLQLVMQQIYTTHSLNTHTHTPVVVSDASKRRGARVTKNFTLLLQ